MFDSVEDAAARLADPDLDVDADSVLILRGCGPRGYPGMPEVANLPLPPKLLEQGVRDMVRISDGRMSGTAYGTVVLHVAPEAAAGGPLGLVRTGDRIVLDVPARRLDLDVPADELDVGRPSEAMRSALAAPARGWERLYIDHVGQADTGADLDFLVGRSGARGGPGLALTGRAGQCVVVGAYLKTSVPPVASVMRQLAVGDRELSAFPRAATNWPDKESSGHMAMVIAPSSIEMPPVPVVVYVPLSWLQSASAL